MSDLPLYMYAVDSCPVSPPFGTQRCHSEPQLRHPSRTHQGPDRRPASCFASRENLVPRCGGEEGDEGAQVGGAAYLA